MARLFSIKPGITLRGRKFLGIRGWNGKPTHPPLTDFPIVCYVVAALFDLVSLLGWFGDGGRFTSRDLFRAATLVLAVGFVVSLATATTGFWDWWKGLQRDRRTGIIGRAAHTQVWRTANWHMTLMLTTTGVVIVDLIVRFGQLNALKSSALAAILSVIAAAIVSFGATYGGSLVFDYQFNVESISGSTVWDETETDQFLGRYGYQPWVKQPKICGRCFKGLGDHAQMCPGAPESQGIRGGEVEISMLFADVRGSSKLARAMPVIDFTRLMNRFYRESSKVLIDGDAIIEKFVGDEIVGLFIPFLAGPEHAARAVETAQELLSVTGHASPDGPWVPLGAGVHTGTAFVGMVGSNNTSDFTALGDPVNIAAHLASH